MLILQVVFVKFENFRGGGRIRLEFMFPVFMLMWGTLELFEPAEEAGDLGGIKNAYI